MAYHARDPDDTELVNLLLFCTSLAMTASESYWEEMNLVPPDMFSEVKGNTGMNMGSFANGMNEDVEA